MDFTKYAKTCDFEEGKKEIQDELEKIKKYSTIIKVIVHT